jgi:hypothetical protein
LEELLISYIFVHQDLNQVFPVLKLNLKIILWEEEVWSLSSQIEQIEG